MPLMLAFEVKDAPWLYCSPKWDLCFSSGDQVTCTKYKIHDTQRRKHKNNESLLCFSNIPTN